MANKSQATALVYCSGLIGFSSLMILAYIHKEYRLYLLFSAFSILFLAYIAEVILFRRRSQSTHASRTWVDIGIISILESLVIDDKLNLATSQRIKRPPGSYRILAEQFQKGSDHYVAAVAVEPVHRTGDGVDFRLRVNCETGFVIFLACDATTQILENVRKAQDRILNDTARTIDVELVYCDSCIIGFVAAAGLGNGQYELELRKADQTLNIRFIKELDEI